MTEPSPSVTPGDPPVPGDPLVPEPEPVPVDPVAPVAPVAPPRRRSRAGVGIVAGTLVAVLAGTTLFIAGWSLGRQTALTPGTPVDEAAAFQPFWDSYRAVTERYAGGDVDRKALVEGAIKGMFGALGDPYSLYMTSDEYRQSLEGLSGQFEGIGATIGTIDAAGANSACTTLTETDCRMAVVAPLAGSPAEKAGLRAGDVITAIDGVAVAGQEVDAARKLVRGAKDTAVTLTVVRGDDAPIDIEIVRDVIVQPEVESRVLANGTVGYHRLAGFSDHAAKQLDEAIEADIEAGRKKLILDLRGNPGGFVQAARDIASEFLADGTVFWERDAEGNLQETVATSGGRATDPEIGLVVLVDGGSASASEIVAGALHDRGRAKLVGSKTFGKGTVQQWTQLEGDSGGFRLTTYRWLTPDKTWIHGTGIEPDVVVTEAPARPGEDPVLDAGLKALGAEALASPIWIG